MEDFGSESFLEDQLRRPSPPHPLSLGHKASSLHRHLVQQMEERLEILLDPQLSSPTPLQQHQKDKVI